MVSTIPPDKQNTLIIFVSAIAVMKVMLCYVTKFDKVLWWAL